MPLTIGQIPVDYLGGPVAFSVLEPTDALQKYCVVAKQAKQFSPILLLADEHESIGSTCKDIPECLQERTVCLSTLSPTWFRLIDTLAFGKKKVDYFFEANIFTKYLDELSQDEFSLTAFNMQLSPLSYVPRYHPKCFQGKNKEFCMTENIRYHVSDIRHDSSMNHYTKEQINKLVYMNELMKHDNLTSKKMYENTLADISNEDIMKEVEKLYIPRIELTNPHYPYFESYLHWVMKHCLSRARTQYGDEKMKFFDIEGSKLWELAINEEEKFYDTIFGHPKFQTSSLFMKQLNKRNTLSQDNSLDDKLINSSRRDSEEVDVKTNDTSCMNTEETIKLCKDFMRYYRKKCPLSQENCLLILEGIHNYTAETRRYKNAISSISKNSKHEECIGAKLSIYEDACHDICTDLFIPITDFLMWIRSVKNSLSSVCTIYNAGEHHTSNFYDFFVNEKKLYNDYFLSGDMRATICFPSLPSRPHLTSPERKEKLIRCLHFKGNLSLDELLYKNDITTPSFIQKHVFLTNRIGAFGIPRYLKMLRGKPFSEEELLNILRQQTGITSVKQFLSLLGMKQVAIPQEYKLHYTIT